MCCSINHIIYYILTYRKNNDATVINVLSNHLKFHVVLQFVKEYFKYFEGGKNLKTITVSEMLNGYPTDNCL